MSAIAKPLIHSTKVIGGASDMVNIEQATAITKSAKPSIDGRNEQPKWNIEFNMADNNVGTPNFITWKYDNVTDRDADFVSIQTLASTVLV